MRTAGARVESGVTFVMPAFNEEATLEASTALVLDMMSAENIPFELIIVDDCSTDRTRQVAEDLSRQSDRVSVAHNTRNLGMGGAFKAGLALAAQPYVMVLPADNEHPSEGIQPILGTMGSHDLVIPFVLNPEVRALHRRLLSRLYVFLVNLAFLQRIPYYNGLVLYKTDLLRSIEVKTNSFSFQTEAILKLLSRGATWKAVGVPLHKPTHTTTKAFRLKNVLGVLGTFIRLRLPGGLS